MEELLTWRTLLGEIVADAQERQRIANALQVNPVSLTRWVAGSSNPRSRHLRALLEALPDRRETLLQLILAEYPHFLLDMSMPEEVPRYISAGVYARILDAYLHLSPVLCASTIVDLVAHHLLSQLDPRQQGMALLLALLTPPCRGPLVRSLYIAQGIGTPGWSQVQYHRQMFGIESPAGYAVQARRPRILNYEVEDERIFAFSAQPPEESVLLYPLLRADQVAGCLCLLSVREHHFSGLYLELIGAYVNLLTLALPASAFYTHEKVILGALPGPAEQRALIAQFEQRVISRLITAEREQWCLKRPDAEIATWQEFEAAFLSTEC